MARKCLDCGEREQDTMYGLCDPCSDARTKRVLESIRQKREEREAARNADPSGQTDWDDWA